MLHDVVARWNASCNKRGCNVFAWVVKRSTLFNVIRYSARFAAMSENKLHIFFARLSYLKPCSEVVFYDISKIGCLELEYILNVQASMSMSSRAGPI